MCGFRCDHILASAAVALVLAAPVYARAQETALAATNPAVKPEVALRGSVTAAVGVVPPAASAPASQPSVAMAPDASAALDPADRAIAERIRDLLAVKPNRLFADEKEYAAVEAFYQKRNLAPLWLDKGMENAHAKAAIARLQPAWQRPISPAK